MKQEAWQTQLKNLTLLLQLEKRAREADPAELPFVMVNETARLLPFKQSALWLSPGGGKGRLEALSGVAAPDLQGPYAQWLGRLFKDMRKDAVDGQPLPFTAGDLPKALAMDWEEWLAPNGVWLPLASPSGRPLGALAFFRAAPWTPADRHVLSYLAGSLGQSLALALLDKGPGTKGGRLGRFSRWGLGLALLVGLMFVPVRDSALAPAEVIPQMPLLIRAPLDGVVEEISVRPNQAVKAGQVLFTLDGARLRSRATVAQKAMEAARAQYEQTQQRALFDPSAKAQLRLLRGRLEELQEEMRYARELLGRIRVTSPQSGVVILDDPDYWRGRPVAQGQRILTVADPKRVQLEVFLPAAEPMRLKQGHEVDFFPNISPDRPITAHIRFISYNAQPTPGRDLSFRLRAIFTARAALPRVGLQGAAKIYGEKIILARVLFRKPWSMLARWLSL